MMKEMANERSFGKIRRELPNLAQLTKVVPFWRGEGESNKESKKNQGLNLVTEGDHGDLQQRLV